VGDSADRRVEILSDDETLNATWSRFGPGRDGADLHVHREHTDLFFVLGGELTLRLGLEDESVATGAGSLVRVPPLVVHGFRNASDGELTYLNMHAPGRRFADYLRAMRDGREFSYDQYDPPPDPRPPSDAAIGGVERTAGGRTVLADVPEIGVAEVDATRDGAPPHVHRQHVESLYVLDGELALDAEGETFRAAQGAWVQIPAGTPHAVRGAARYLDVHTPSFGVGTLDEEPAG
jgi:quercetin dioxygenase-like cupin family protein